LSRIRSSRRTLLAAVAAPAALLAAGAGAQEPPVAPPEGWAEDPPKISALVAFERTVSDLRTAILSYVEDGAVIGRRYPVRYSPVRMDRYEKFYDGWAAELEKVEFDGLNHEGRIDYILLRNQIRYDQAMLDLQRRRAKEIAPLIPFFDDLRALDETRLDRERAEPKATAITLDEIAKEANRLAEELEAEAAKAGGVVNRRGVSKVAAMRAADQLQHLREILAKFNGFYDGYDPMYTFWARKPAADADAALQTYADALREYVVGIKPGGKPPIIGDPVGSEGLEAGLAVEMIPYSAEEMIDISRQEFRWIKDQMLEVTERMGYGDDWHAALDHTKDLAPPPGEVAWELFDIADYEEAYIEDLGVITLPPLSREVWRLYKSSPELQLRNPFFAGGEETRMSYPKDVMELQDKLMSQRGNTPHFNFPTVHHELVPGHHLQGFMFRRFNDHRAKLNRTPFNIEGWALYWEFVLWDDPDFPRNDPDRMGMLFWRLHRAARIVFSLNYHLGNWSPQECIDFLVEEVGHERANAEAEVRRTTIDAALYQIAYMTGALQLRALHKEAVENGDLTEKKFHNGYLVSGPMPIEMLRNRLKRSDLSRDYETNWRFYESISRE